MHQVWHGVSLENAERRVGCMSPFVNHYQDLTPWQNTKNKLHVGFVTLFGMIIMELLYKQLLFRCSFSY